MSALSTAAALPFVVPPAIAQEILLDQDREILDLATKILALLPFFNAASEATAAADDLYLERMPERSDAAPDEYQAACAALRSDLRCDELLEEFERNSREMSDLVQRMVTLRASSLQALRAKAAVYARHLHVGYRHDSSAMDDQFELLASIIEDLGGSEPVA